MRTLGRLGVRVYALEHHGVSPSNGSRFCAGTVRAGDNGRPIGDAASIVEELERAGRRLGAGTILISGTDEWAVFVAEHAEELSRVFRFPRPPAELVERLASKIGLFEIASRHGFPSPRLVVPRSLDHAAEIAGGLTYPVMVKPVVSRPDVDSKAVVSTPAELFAYAREHAESPDDPNLLFQEYIPGTDADVWMFTGYFDGASRCLAAFTGRKLRQCPAHMGHTSLGVAEPNPKLVAQASRFLADVGYSGIVDSGYRFDARDGTYKILDVNPRVGGNFRQFISANDLDVVRALYLDLAGMPMQATEQVDGRRWLKEDSDLVAMVQYRRLGELDLRSWLKSLRHIDEGATFAIDDPMPFFSAMALVVTDTVAGRWQRRRHSVRATPAAAPRWAA
jgi:predicted ATP-grasp superfamily ATP-dependent carboligase